MPKEIYKSAYSLAKELELHLQLAQKCLRSLDATVLDVTDHAATLESLAEKNALNLSTTIELANELKQSIERLKLAEQAN
ncbi:hypothetical protein [Vibrio rarus]|uniref:hypothetical protein n=1 Tax=Vibrio rarus TaxID=413403 RepID=UPI0021C477B8|nr:hypothetical protein [Vibrio rarus]